VRVLSRKHGGCEIHRLSDEKSRLKPAAVESYSRCIVQGLRFET
jgi:hypothetical protein